MINTINTNKSVDMDFYTKYQSQKSEAATTEEKLTYSDQVEINKAAGDSVAFAKDKYLKSNAGDLAELKRITENIVPESLRNYVKSLLLHQGTYKNSDPYNTHVLDNNDFSIKAVSDRIVDFAIAVSGYDNKKLEEIKTGIDKGFAEAGEAFGGELPNICNQTYDEIMRKLDEWSQSDNN